MPVYIIALYINIKFYKDSIEIYC